MKRKSAKEFARHLRREQTEAETLFWQAVRNRRFLNLKFRRQVPVNKFFADFLCESEKLIVEIDDDSHEAKVDKDIERTDVLISHGNRVVRYWNEEIYDDLDAVLRDLTKFVGQS